MWIFGDNLSFLAFFDKTAQVSKIMHIENNNEMLRILIQLPPFLATLFSTSWFGLSDTTHVNVLLEKSEDSALDLLATSAIL